MNLDEAGPTALERLAAINHRKWRTTPRWKVWSRHLAWKRYRQAFSDYAESIGYTPGTLKVVGMGPFKLPGEDYRMQRAYVEAKQIMHIIKMVQER